MERIAFPHLREGPLVVDSLMTMLVRFDDSGAPGHFAILSKRLLLADRSTWGSCQSGAWQGSWPLTAQCHVPQNRPRWIVCLASGEARPLQLGSNVVLGPSIIFELGLCSVILACPHGECRLCRLGLPVSSVLGPSPESSGCIQALRRTKR